MSIACWVALAASLPWTAPGLQVARDFAAFWTAARLAVEGHAADVYGDRARDALAALFGHNTYPPFFYPPTGLLLWFPFGFMPFVTAATLWITASVIAYALAIRALAGRGSLLLALACPAVPICGVFGQNSLLSAALFAGAAVRLERFPVLAGVLIGGFAYKPQLAVLAPLALAAAGRWRAGIAAALTVGGLAGLSALAFGTPTWVGFFAVLPDAQAFNANGVPGFDKYASPYAAMRLLGASARLAWSVQGAIAAAAVIALLTITRARPGGAAEIAMLVSATAFCVPFLGVYDLAIFTVAGAWLAAAANRTSWLPYERAGLAIIAAAPLAIVPAAKHGMPLAPAALLMLAALVMRRLACGRSFTFS